MATAIVTGAAGFIGSRLCQMLLDAGWAVRGVDCFTDYYSTSIKQNRIQELDRHVQFDFSPIDLSLDSLAPLGDLKSVAAVFHLAGQPGVRGSWGDTFDQYLNHNVLATQRLLEWAKAAVPAARFIYASSSSVYGDAVRYPTSENDFTRPVSPYGVTKLAGEHLALLYARNHGLLVTALRFHTVYGPGQRPDMAIHRMIRSAHDQTPFHLFGAGEFVRDFTYVDDIVRGCCLAADAEKSIGEVINLAGGSAVTMNDLANKIHSIVGRPVALVDSGTVRGDVAVTGGSIDKARSLLDWSPHVSLEAGLRAQADALGESAKPQIPA